MITFAQAWRAISEMGSKVRTARGFIDYDETIEFDDQDMFELNQLHQSLGISMDDLTEVMGTYVPAHLAAFGNRPVDQNNVEIAQTFFKLGVLVAAYYTRENSIEVAQLVDGTATELP